ncbi:hypothetical protein BASA83_002308 [Batrachochytrium salamandrivorans]|nr:hypothetical protein BASA83_002308 [Batrachochytrium salamandrivorans]
MSRLPIPSRRGSLCSEYSTKSDKLASCDRVEYEAILPKTTTNVRVCVRICPDGVQELSCAKCRGNPLNATPFKSASSTRTLSSRKPLSSTSCRKIGIQQKKIIVEGLYCKTEYGFDSVYGEASCQSEIFDAEIIPMIDLFLPAMIAPLFAIAQLQPCVVHGSHAVDEAIGVVPRAISLLFDTIQKTNSSSTTSVSISFLELYNEELKDLLKGSVSKSPYFRPTSRIQIQKQKNGRVFINGAIEMPVSSKIDAIKCLQRGIMARSTAFTCASAASSRSHAIIYITLKRRINHATTITSRFHFFDLASLENFKNTKRTGEELVERVSINQDLLKLDKVISAITKNTIRSPNTISEIGLYQESKLARLLQNNIEGNSKTLILACISMHDSDYEETIDTLKYATTSKTIQNSYQSNLDYAVQDKHYLNELYSRIKDLEIENNRLNHQFPKYKIELGFPKEMETQVLKLSKTVQILETEVSRLAECKNNAELVDRVDTKDLEEQGVFQQKYLGDSDHSDTRLTYPKVSNETLILERSWDPAPLPPVPSVTRVPLNLRYTNSTSALLNDTSRLRDSIETSFPSSLDIHNDTKIAATESRIPFICNTLNRTLYIEPKLNSLKPKFIEKMTLSPERSTPIDLPDALKLDSTSVREQILCDTFVSRHLYYL